MTELEKYFYKKKVVNRIGVSENYLASKDLVTKTYYKLYDFDQDKNDQK